MGVNRAFRGRAVRMLRATTKRMRRIAALLVTSVLLLSTASARAEEARRPRNDLFVAGIVLTSLSVLSAGYGMYSINNPRRELAIADGDGSERSQRPQPYVYAFASAGILAAIGVPMLVVGARSRAQVAVAPTVGGLVIAATF